MTDLDKKVTSYTWLMRNALCKQMCPKRPNRGGDCAKCVLQDKELRNMRLGEMLKFRMDGD